MPHNEKKSASTFTHLTASSIVAGLEIAVFHPGDTFTKRLSISKEAFINPGESIFTALARSKKIGLTRKGTPEVPAIATPMQKYLISKLPNFPKIQFLLQPKKTPATPTLNLSETRATRGLFSAEMVKATGKVLYPGVIQAVGYKVAQRAIKFTVQPVVEERLIRNIKPDQFGIYTPAITAAFAGSIGGWCELLTLPLDILKIRKQNSSMDIGFSYRGFLVTAARNGCGSFALFGVPAFLKVRNPKQSRAEKVGGNFAGSITSLCVSSPFDVVKTRMQSDIEAGSGIKIVKDIMLNEKPTAFFKGMGPKVLMQGFKLTCFMTVKDLVVEQIEAKLEEKASAAALSKSGLFSPSKIIVSDETKDILRNSFHINRNRTF